MLDYWRVHPRKLTAGQQKPSPGAFPQEIPIFRDQKIWFYLVGKSESLFHGLLK